MLKPFSLIVAYSKNRGIGLRGGFPWPVIKKDLKHFQALTQETKFAKSIDDFARENCLYMSDAAQKPEPA